MELSERERDLLGCVVRDLTYEQIAHELGLSTKTVRTYLRSLRIRLGVRSRVGVAVWALHHGFREKKQRGG